MENVCAGVYLFHHNHKETPAQAAVCEFCENFNNIYFIEHLWPDTSDSLLFILYVASRKLNINFPFSFETILFSSIFIFIIAESNQLYILRLQGVARKFLLGAFLGHILSNAL